MNTQEEATLEISYPKAGPKNMTRFTGRLPALGVGIVVVSLLSGCVSTRIGISYTPQTNPAPVIGTSRCAVNVDVNDVRLKKSVGTVHISGGEYTVDSTYIILATNDIVSVFKEAIEDELAKRGFTLSEKGVTILVGLNTFYCGPPPARATAAVSVQVRKSDGTIIYSKLVTAQGKNPHIRMDQGLRIQGALDNALQNWITLLFADPSFNDVLLKASEGLENSS